MGFIEFRVEGLGLGFGVYIRFRVRKGVVKAMGFAGFRGLGLGV